MKKKHSFKIAGLIISGISALTITASAQNIFPVVGNSGIGTMTPLEALHIKTGTIRLDDLSQPAVLNGLRIVGVDGLGNMKTSSSPTDTLLMPQYMNFSQSFAVPPGTPVPLFVNAAGALTTPTPSNPLPNLTIASTNTLFTGAINVGNGGISVQEFSGLTGYHYIMTDPDGHLTVGPDISIAPPITAGKFWKLNGNDSVSSSYHFLGTINQADLVFKTFNQEQMRITSAGQFNFGNSNYAIKGIAIEADNLDGAAYINNWNTGVLANGLTVSISNDNAKIFSGYGSDESFYVKGSGEGYFAGRLGIGTTLPQAKLDITHNDASGGLILNRKSTTTAKSQISFRQNENEKWSMGIDPQENNANSFFIYGGVSPSIKLFINELGGVGIGTTQLGPQTKLGVEGMIVAREVKVSLDNFPDYVFDKHYKLRTLGELENYINANHHLPEMPSAQQVKKDQGVELGEMNRKLVEKVEELTLYVIQLKKELDEVKEKQNKGH